MTDDKIVGFPTSTAFQPEQALHSALQLQPSEVLIIGIDKDGDLIIRSSHMTREKAAFLAYRAFLWAHKVVDG